MDLITLGEYGLKTALNVGLRLKKLYTSEVDDGIIAAFIMRKTKCKRFCKTKCSDGGKRNALENLYKVIGSIRC